MASINPINDMLVKLAEADLREKRAMLDLQEAQMKKRITGQGAVPGVATELAKREMQRNKQKEAIAKQEQQGQATAMQGLAPPMVDVSGQTGGRDMGAMFKGATEIARQVSGARGLRQQGMVPDPSVGPSQTIQQTVGMGQAGPSTVQPAPGAAATSPAGQVPVGTTTQQGAPGSIVQQTRDMPWWEQALYIGGGALTRNPWAIVQGIRGEEVIGERRIPTVDEQAAKLAPGLSVLIGRANSSDPAIAQAAQAQLDQRRDQMEQISPELAGAAYRQGEDLWLLRDEKERLKDEEPLRRKAELEFEIEDQVAQHGVGSLTQGQREVWERGRNGVTVVNQLDLSKGGKVYAEKELMESHKVLQRLDAFDEAFFAEGYQFMSGADEIQLMAKDRSGLITPEEKARLTRYGDQKTALADLNVNVIYKFLGKQQSAKELESVNDLIIKMSRGGTRARAAAAQLREQVGLGAFRYETVLEKNSLSDPRFAMKLGNVKQAARDAADKRFEELMASGTISEAEAVNQVRMDFKNRWGLDLDRLQGNR